MRKVLRDQSGVATMILALFGMMVTVVVFTGVNSIQQVFTQRQQMAQVLSSALTAAMANGAILTSNGQCVTWDAVSAQLAADQIVKDGLSTSLPSPSVGAPQSFGSSGRFQGLTMVSFDTGAEPLSSCVPPYTPVSSSITECGISYTVSGAYVAACLEATATVQVGPLSVPVTIWVAKMQNVYSSQDGTQINQAQ